MKPDCPECGGQVDVFDNGSDCSIDCVDCGAVLVTGIHIQ